MRCGKVWKTILERQSGGGGPVVNVHMCCLDVNHLGNHKCACELPPHEHIHPSREMLRNWMYTS